MEHTLVRATLAVATVLLSGLAPAVAGQSADPCEPQRLVTPPDVPPQTYGFSAATNSRFWFVGDRAARTVCAGTSLGCQAGAVHVYELVDGQLAFAQTLVPPDVSSGSNFGIGLDADSDRLVVGAPFFRTPESSGGTVFVYEFDGDEWVEADRIHAPSEVTSGFGTRVVVHGDTLVVWPNLSQDRVFVYRLEGGRWTRVQTIQPEPDALNWRFGYAMHLDHQWLFVGAPYDGTITPSGGSVYAYTREADGTFEFEQRLEADYLARFGESVEFNGRSLLIGEPGYSPDFEAQGGVSAFEFDGDSWSQTQQFVHTGAGQDQAFGSFLELDGGILLAATSSELTPEGRGSVYHFEQGADGVWRENKRLIPNPPAHVVNFGVSMAINNDWALVGAYREPGGGAAYFFDLVCNPCPPDLDADGSLTIFDYLTFLNLFQDDDAQADFDGDGELTVFDFLAFQTAFDAGC